MILKTDPHRPDPTVVQVAAQALARGELVIIPTDTVYGLAADLRVPGAQERLFRAKGRPSDKPLVRLAAGMDVVTACGADWTPRTRKLAHAFWPGGLTLVLPCDGKSVGFRVPSHKVALSLLHQVGTALAVSSANLSGGETDPLTADEAVADLQEHAALAIDAGPAPGGVASTVVRVNGEQLEVLRDGAVAPADLLAVWNEA